MKKSYALWNAWSFAVVILFFLTILYKGESDKFLALCDNAEEYINFSHSVRLKNIYVETGQETDKGELLATVTQEELSDELLLLKYEINKLKAKKVLEEEKLKNEIKELKVKRSEEISLVDYQIGEIRFKQRENRKLLAFVLEHPVYKKSEPDLGIRFLLSKKRLIKKRYSVKIANIKERLVLNNRLISKEISKLLKKEELLSKKEANLNIYAKKEGIIGSVNYYQGEEIPPFKPLLTFYDKYPKTLKGYVHENLANRIREGEEVFVSSVSKTKRELGYIKGKVKSVGKRIVAFPKRLTKFQNIPVWGYEVLIEMPKNSFLFGEKVFVYMDRPPNLLDLYISKIKEFFRW